MESREFIPAYQGQVERLIMTIEQMRVLASPAVTDVYETFEVEVPRSIPDASKALGKAQATVGAHVATLLEAGFLMVVGTRRSGARTERLFVKTSKVVNTQFAGQPWEYAQAAIAGYDAWMRRQMRAHALLRRRAFLDPEENVFHQMLVGDVVVTAEVAKQIKQEIRDLHNRITELAETSPPQEGERGEHLAYLLTINPSEGSSRRWLAEHGEEPTD